MVTPSACAAEHTLLQRLQHESESRTERSCSIAHNTSSSSSSSSSLPALAQLWLLSVLLIITIAASSWPTGTSAAPRLDRGVHHIWPLPISSTEPSPAKEPSVLIINQTEGLNNCRAMEVTAKARAPGLQKALKKAQNCKDTVICLTEDWLQNFYSGSNITAASNQFRYLCLDLEHPLRERVSKVTLTAEGQFEYEGPVGSLEEEMPKIIETLLVLEALIESVPYDKLHYPCTFKHFKDAVQSNTATAMVQMKEQQCNAPKEIHYKRNLVRLPFFVAMETIKVLTVLEFTYDQLLKAYQEPRSEPI